MLTPGWRWVCGGNDIWIGPWQTEDMNKRAGHNPSAFWHLPAGCSYSLVPEENWLAFPSSTVESLVPSSVYLRGLQGLSFLLDTFLQSLSLFSVYHHVKPFFFHLSLPHITPILRFSKHPSQRLLRVWIWRNPRRAAAWPTIGNILLFISHIPHPTFLLISEIGNTWPAVLFGGATLPVVKAYRKMKQSRREYDCPWRCREWRGPLLSSSVGEKSVLRPNQLQRVGKYSCSPGSHGPGPVSFTMKEGKHTCPWKTMDIVSSDEETSRWVTLCVHMCAPPEVQAGTWGFCFPATRVTEGRVGEGREYSLRRKGCNKVVTREKRGITSGAMDGSNLPGHSLTWKVTGGISKDSFHPQVTETKCKPAEAKKDGQRRSCRGSSSS